MTPDEACTLHRQLQFRSANHPTRVGEALRTIIALHSPEPGLDDPGPVCKGDDPVGVAYPCRTVRAIAGDLRVALPAEVGHA